MDRSYTLEKRDWFETQEIKLNVGSLEWDAIANKPGTSDYVSARGGRFDEVHVVVIDDKGDITGNAGTILEKHLNLSKAKDAEFSVGSPSYWRKYLYTNSDISLVVLTSWSYNCIAHLIMELHSLNLMMTLDGIRKLMNVNFGGSGT